MMKEYRFGSDMEVVARHSTALALPLAQLHQIVPLENATEVFALAEKMAAALRKRDTGAVLSVTRAANKALKRWQLKGYGLELLTCEEIRRLGHTP